MHVFIRKGSFGPQIEFAGNAPARVKAPLTLVPAARCKRKKHFHREPVPVDKARAAYDRLKNWRLVAEEVLREDGSKFTVSGIFNAVRWADKGNAGRLNGHTYIPVALMERHEL